MKWKNLAPQLVRQRVIIEGTTQKIVEPEQIKSYLDELAKITKMEKLSGPYAYSAHDIGFVYYFSLKSFHPFRRAGDKYYTNIKIAKPSLAYENAMF
ncbi:MAG: hypothetical protein NT034_02705 [Candidatus Magasanikbacteria bacterium]|nr:hypothetical protein [Candidatus Magasanikbacteria bacterium]